MEKIHKQDDGCWSWTAFVDPRTGYGLFRMPTGTTQAHRAAYQLLVAPIPRGLTIDHRCRNKRCVNPSHLEPVPMQVNIDRGPSARRLFCVNGHAMSPDNCGNRSDGRRYCAECHRQDARLRHAAYRLGLYKPGTNWREKTKQRLAASQ
jgi:hypothetical protein